MGWRRSTSDFFLITPRTIYFLISSLEAYVIGKVTSTVLSSIELTLVGDTLLRVCTRDLHDDLGTFTYWDEDFLNLRVPATSLLRTASSRTKDSGNYLKCAVSRWYQWAKQWHLNKPYTSLQEYVSPTSSAFSRAPASCTSTAGKIRSKVLQWLPFVYVNDANYVHSLSCLSNITEIIDSPRRSLHWRRLSDNLVLASLTQLCHPFASEIGSPSSMPHKI